MEDPFYSFICNVSSELSQFHSTRLLEIGIEGCVIRGRCATPEDALLLSDCYEPFKKHGLGLKLEVVGVEGLYDFIPPMHSGEAMLKITYVSEFLSQHRSLVPIFTEKATYTVHRNHAEAGFPCIDVAPRLGLESVLNIPISVQLRNAINANTVVGSAKMRAIHSLLEALERGDDYPIEHVQYEHFWEGRWWRKIASATLWGKEIVCVTRAAPEQAAWQDAEWFARSQMQTGL